MDSLKEKQIVELIKNRLDLNYVQVSFLTGVPLTTVHKVAKDNVFWLSVKWRRGVFR